MLFANVLLLSPLYSLCCIDASLSLPVSLQSTAKGQRCGVVLLPWPQRSGIGVGLCVSCSLRGSCLHADLHLFAMPKLQRTRRWVSRCCTKVREQAENEERVESDYWKGGLRLSLMNTKQIRCTQNECVWGQLGALKQIMGARFEILLHFLFF